MKFQQSGVPLDPDEFAKILGKNSWNLADYERTERMTGEERKAFARLLRAHDFDGVRYTNNCEPPGKAGGTAYFVLNTTQIMILGSEPLETSVPSN